MTRYFQILLALIFISNFQAKAQDKTLVQVTGVVRLVDTSEGIPYMGIFVKGKASGTLSNENGLFSLLAHKGDTLIFSRVGFAPREINIPADWKGNFFTTTQYFTQDTFMLKEFIVKAYLNEKEFDYAMRYKEYDPDINKAIKENTSKDVLAMMIQNLPNGNGEGAALMQRQSAYQNSYYGQQAPIGLFNPFKWAEFYKSVKNGDYNKKKD